MAGFSVHAELPKRGASDTLAEVSDHPPSDATPKAQVCLLIGSGIVAAAQIGKAIITVPLIRAELSLGLDVAGLIIALFATLGATIGIGAGAAVGRFGVRRSLIGGMALIALGNAIGAFAPDARVLLLARIVEGVGFFGVVLAIPSTLTQILTQKRARDFAMAAWSAYMPGGIMLMLLLGPVLPSTGWRNFWLADAGVAAALALVLSLAVVRLPARPVTTPAFHAIARVLRDPACLALAGAFFAYSCQIFALAFALPLLLTSQHGVSLGTAGLLSAMVLAVSTAGHLASGFLLRGGVPVWANLAAAFGFFVLSGLAIFGSVLGAGAVALTAALALGIGGLAPGAIYAAAPYAAPTRDAVPMTIGLFQQASNLGQFAGPLALGLWAQQFGWSGAPSLLAPVAMVGLMLAFVVRGRLRADAPDAVPAPIKVRGK